jgi:hypothetical protein
MSGKGTLKLLALDGAVGILCGVLLARQAAALQAMQRAETVWWRRIRCSPAAPEVAALPVGGRQLALAAPAEVVELHTEALLLVAR